MNILVISLYYEPDQCQSNGPIIRALCEDWAEAGHEVTVLTSFPHYSRDEVWPEYRGRWFQRDRVGKVRVIRSYIFVPRTRSALGRILNYLSFNLSSTLAGLVTGRQDVIFAMSPPLTIGVTGFLLGVLKRVPFCYNLQDIWPDVAVKLGMLRGRRTIAFFAWLERLIYRRARRIFAISDEFKRNLLGKGVPEDKIAVIPNFTDTQFIRPQTPSASFRQKHGLNERFVVLYAGNLGLSQGLEAILDAAESLKAREELLFLIVGQGTCREELLADARRRALTNVRFLPLLPESEVPLLYAACDLALIPLKRGIAENSVPCKTYSIMAAGKPYIAGVDEGSNVWKLTEQAGSGRCVPPEDGGALARAVLQLQANPAVAETMGRNGRAYVERHFAREAITHRYRIELESLAAPRAVPLPAMDPTKGKTT
ncbi:MAG: glycosyltransferase family 4 protein [Blastocatellia bacterium]|nr:glycosyltransferase family 4 protein [Blastocatellia bacterium]